MTSAYNDSAYSKIFICDQFIMQTTKEVMQVRAIVALFFVSATVFFGSLSAGGYRWTNNDFEYVFSGVYKPESVFGKNINWFNNDNQADKVYSSLHTLDILFNMLYGAQTYAKPVAEFLFQMRNKGVWGNPESYGSTTLADTKELGVVRGAHRHGLPRLFFWIRQIWLSFDIGQAVGLPFTNTHTFTLGAFPFQLGKGIALGDAYAAGHGVFGFYTDSVINQYAFGTKFSGELIANKLSYDLYTAILQNNSSSLGDTEKKIFGQEFGRLENPARGFGSVNYIMAGRFNWKIFDNLLMGKLTLEPYALYNNDPEQKIEFVADASSKLGTVGFAGDYYGNRFECGFDYAVNLGQQRVKGWDRNIIKENNRQGQVVLINDNVTATYLDASGNSVTEPVPYVDRSDAQNIINKTFRDESQNDQEIGTVTSVGYLTGTPASPIVLKNSAGRFGNPYTNKYEGWMFVIDGAYAMLKKDLYLGFTVGLASGDDNPNHDTKDGIYSGFIGLQEIYSGKAKRVRSPFVLGGGGKLKRFLSTPTSVQSPSKEAQSVSGFTNLIFCGTALTWNPKAWKKSFELNPNILAFWQERQIGNARTFLGVESSLFINYALFKDLKLFWVSSLFFPGSHYKDRMGTPALNQAQLNFADSEDPTGFTQDRITMLGANVAYSFNLGLIYSF